MATELETFRILAISEKEQEEIIELAKIGLSLKELSLHFSRSEELIEELYEKGLIERKIELLTLQWKKAGQLDPALLIHLGKTLCNQTEKIETHHKVESIPFEGLSREELIKRIQESE